MHNTCSLFVFNVLVVMVLCCNYVLVIQIIDMIENCFLQIILQINVFILINWVSFLYYIFFPFYWL